LRLTFVQLYFESYTSFGNIIIKEPDGSNITSTWDQQLISIENENDYRIAWIATRVTSAGSITFIFEFTN